jgi:hypothetical protein
MRIIKRVWAWLSRSKTPLIVEFKERVSEGDENAIPALMNHPGFLALMHKLYLQRAFLETRLKTTRHKDIRDVDILLTGLAWLGYLESQVASATNSKRVQVSREATGQEEEGFSRILSFIESIGTTSPQ